MQPHEAPKRKSLAARLADSLSSRLTLRQVLSWPAIIQVLLVALALGFLSIRQQWLDTQLISTQLRDETAQHFLKALLADLHEVRQTAEQNALNVRAGVLGTRDAEAWQRYLYAQNVVQTTLSASFLTLDDGRFLGLGRNESGEISFVEADPAMGAGANVYELDESGRAGLLRKHEPGYDARKRPWWERTLKAKAPVWTLVPDSILFFDAGLLYSVPVFDVQGNLSAVCSSRIGLHKFSKLVNDLAKESGASLYLLDRQGRVVVSSNPEVHPETPSSDTRFPVMAALGDHVSTAVAARLAEERITTPDVTGPVNLEMRARDGAYMVTVRPVPDMAGLDWILVSALPTSPLLRTMQDNFILATLLAGLAVVAAAVIGRMASRWVLSPVQELRTQAAGVAMEVLRGDSDSLRGKLESPSLSPEVLGRHDELGDLARVFQNMVQGLGEAFEQLRQREKTLRAHYKGLEQHVNKRTEEISAANAKLTREAAEHRITEAALRRAHGQLRAVFDAMPGMIFVIDKEFNVIDASERYLECLRPQAETGVIGQKCHQIVRGSDEPCPYCQTLATEQYDSVASRFSTSEEEAFFGHQFKVYSAPITDDSGETWGYVECVMDISDLRRMEQSLLEARLRAEAANDAKSSFLANVSHEIRTPLTGILGLADLIDEARLDETSRDNLRLLRESGGILLGVINDVLDLSKIEAGTCLIEEKPFSLRQTVDSLAKLFAPQMKGQPVSMTFHVAEHLPDVYYGDALRLRQVLLNLVGNAVKFTSLGLIQVNVEAAAHPLSTAENQGQLKSLLFTVSDTGCGIPPDHQETVFENFTQVDSSVSRRHTGTGLGLAISRRLVELMGGELWLRSQVDQGSTFSFTVQLKPIEAKASDQAGQASVPVQAPAPDQTPRPPETGGDASRPGPEAGEGGLRLLVAEDNHINQKLMERLLTKRGHAITVVEDGERAVAAVRDGTFDAVFMDIQMPGTDGIEATRRIRAGGGASANIPIIALTAHALSGDKERFLAEGFNDYLSKPLDKAELDRVLGSLAGGPTPLGQGLGASPAAQAGPDGRDAASGSPGQPG